MDHLFRLLDSTADGAFVINQDQHILYWNQAAETLLGYPAEEVLGRPCYEVLRGCDDQGRIICCEQCYVVGHMRQGKLVKNYDVAMHHQSGKVCWLNVSILTGPSTDDNSTPLLIHLLRDATHKKKNDAFIQHLLETAKRLQELAASAIPMPPYENLGEELTAREREVLSLLAHGHSTSDIATTLSISTATVRNHVQNILHKLQVHSRLEAVAYAFEHGLIQWP